jgi:hypothetical protein
MAVNFWQRLDGHLFNADNSDVSKSAAFSCGKAICKSESYYGFNALYRYRPVL